MRVAALDLGSNSVKLTIAEVRADRTLDVLVERAEITRVGEGLEKNGFLLETAMERTLATLSAFRESIDTEHVDAVRVVATAGLRGATNAERFLERARTQCGLEIEIIGGLREAELAFRAPASAYGPGPLLVVDVGGRSTELITGTLGAIEARVSLALGGVALTERYHPSDPPAEEELQSSAAAIRRLLDGAPRPAPGAKMVGVCGTVLALMGVQLGVDDMEEATRRGEGQPLYRSTVRSTFEAMKAIRAADRIRGSVIPAGRADVFVAAAQLVDTIMEHYQAEQMVATHRGVRYGLISEMIEGAR